MAACYALLRMLTANADAALLGTAFLSLCPGFVLFFPMFDPLYAGLAAAVVALWATGIERDRLMLAAAGGAMLAATTFMTFNVLVIGFFMLGVALVISPRPRIARLLRHALTLAAACAACYLLLWIVSGYNPIATFASAWRNQHALLATHASERPYPSTIWNDLLDFALGSGWISFIIAGIWIARAMRRRPWDRVTRIVLLAAAQIFVVAVAGLLQSETARVWNFMLPLLAVPIGLELASWPRGARVGVIVSRSCCSRRSFRNDVLVIISVRRRRDLWWGWRGPRRPSSAAWVLLALPRLSPRWRPGGMPASPGRAGPPLPLPLSAAGFAFGAATGRRLRRGLVGAGLQSSSARS